MNVVCQGTGLQHVKPIWEEYTAADMMTTFQLNWVSHYGWPETIIHDQGSEFMGAEFQRKCAEHGVLTVPIDSKSPWQNGKTERAGDMFKKQRWDLDDECHITGAREFEEAISSCCDSRNRYCNRSGYSAHQRVFGSSLRLPGSLLSDDPIDRQMLAEDPFTEFSRSNDTVSYTHLTLPTKRIV